MLAIIITIIILILMTVAIFFLLRYQISKLNEKAKVYFMLKTQEYTNKVIIKSEKSDKKEDNTKVEKNFDNSNKSVIYVDNSNDYVIDNLFSIMRHVDDKFVIDNKKIVENFVKNNKDDGDDYHYKKLIEMKKYIDSIGVYNIITNDKPKLVIDIRSKLRLIDEDIYNEFFQDRDDFDVGDFINFLELEIGKYDPTIYVYVGNYEINYDYIDKRVKTMYDSKIYKGIKIVYKNVMYDYSLE